MAESRTKVLLRFASHKFYVKPKEIRSFSGLKIKASLNTEDQTVDGQKFTTKKGAGALEVSFTAILDQRTGASVYADAKALIDAAVKGESGYLYVENGTKPWTAKLMMTEAEITNVSIMAGGQWIYAEVAVTLKQCTKADGTTESSAPAENPGGGGGGARTYRVKAYGMGEVKVTATSVLGAIHKACGSKYTGIVSVDGVSYTLKDGKFVPKEGEGGTPPNPTENPNPNPDPNPGPTPQELLDQAAQDVQDWIDNFFGKG